MNMSEKSPFVFGKKNYQLMFLGLGLILAGFLVMGLETAPYGFGFLGLTLGPILTLTGFVVEIWAIIAKDKPSQQEPGAQA